eukprot:CAMPEP_0168600268 /NCGR_PEP_ID=MMETSP0420-20121227/12669_1 /TAXON_ID=498008 /ORGANISM="Pessonella sp." /LENGTH=220 /DNA_ID=CAMNT_0008638299 /DNA_START=313 /DNA_END=975 /DNA_ORIENTATION=+
MSQFNRFWQQSRNIICIGRNFAEHAKELSNKTPSKPFFFLKPTSSFVRRGEPIVLPIGAEVHHEVELAIIIKHKIRKVNADEALDAVAGYALALDLTARNEQFEAKKQGLPWTQAKGYDTFCPIGDFIDQSLIEDPQNVQLCLQVNGEEKQNGNTSDMIFDVKTLISSISNVMSLNAFDVILTGTPAGVGQLKHGDRVQSQLKVNGKELAALDFHCKDDK